MNKKTILSIFAVLLVVGFAFGCTGSSETNTTTEKVETPAKKEAEPVKTTTDEFAGLKNPSEVKNILDLYDANKDGKIEFLDEYNDMPDGIEEYVLWTYDAGFREQHASEATALFVRFDKNGDWHWDKSEIDAFFSS